MPLFKIQVDYFLHRLHISDRNRTFSYGGYCQSTFLLILIPLGARAYGDSVPGPLWSVMHTLDVPRAKWVEEKSSTGSRRKKWQLQKRRSPAFLVMVGTMKSSEFRRYLVSRGVRFIEGSKHTKLYFNGMQSVMPRHANEIGEGLRRRILGQLKIKDW